MQIRGCLTHLKNKVIIITGASSRIGKTIARHLGVQRTNMLLAARRRKKLNQIGRDLESHAYAFTGDVKNIRNGQC